MRTYFGGARACSRQFNRSQVKSRLTATSWGLINSDMNVILDLIAGNLRTPVSDKYQYIPTGNALLNIGRTASSGSWLWELALGVGSGSWLRELPLGVGSGSWLWELALGVGSGSWLRELALGVSSGSWLWELLRTGIYGEHFSLT